MPHPAVIEIQGVPFCERCALEQEAYFAVGELTQELAADRVRQVQDFGDGLLIETVCRTRWTFAGRTASEAETHPSEL